MDNNLIEYLKEIDNISNEELIKFSKKLIWPLAHKLPNQGVTTDYFQYLILIKSSQAMEGIETFSIE